MGLHELVLLRVGSRGAAVKKLQSELGIGADGIFGAGTKKAVMDFQSANGLAADGMAGPLTLAKMASFSGEFSAATVANAEVRADEEHFESEPLPEIKGAQPIEGSATETAPSKSVWGRVKGWFS
ncbi:peptidoglycan-binding domain-containing protein [Hoeflea prorocentri]|uniref:Peptidoglycan-binding domain-containing protein n=2 Tax=Hoeflea prorocentri TaxID=1922333 RepID=A0A9X3ULB7_9HYPH|nr:peptidoglycan-binding domain-containing protein [Hoeflea prorocentri]MDA5400476.1 peptidoglycan-binding domain-containing protein [Hoeflea prorocentri]